MPHFTPVKRNGSRVYVAGMAASSIRNNRYALSTCDDCGREVAWAQSSRTQKWYPCRVVSYTTEGGNPRHRAMPYEPHRCREVWVFTVDDNPYITYITPQEFDTQQEALDAQQDYMKTQLEAVEAWKTMAEEEHFTEKQKAAFMRMHTEGLTRLANLSTSVSMHYRKGRV